MKCRLLPGAVALAGVLVSIICLVVAAAGYPGGYDWFGQSISSLFQPLASDGSHNSSRLLAALAVMLFCSSIAVLFDAIAKKGPSRVHRKTIQAAGIGSMVYAALVVTPMHDTLVGVALVFFVAAIFTILHWLYLQRRYRMLAAGLVCLALTIGNASMYYGEVLYGFLPIVQKVSLILWVVWLFGLYKPSSQNSLPLVELDRDSDQQRSDRQRRPGADQNM